MFPCNFLSYLRVHYSEQHRENYAVFTHTIKPMLNTVKMHPMLVTQTKGNLIFILESFFDKKGSYIFAKLCDFDLICHVT